jgi:hypothetical protein
MCPAAAVKARRRSRVALFTSDLNLTPGGSPSVNSTPKGLKRVANERFLVRRYGRLTGDTFGTLDNQ